MTSKAFERKLSAILSADVAGYSRLMGSDEEFTITTLTGHREMMSTLIENHNGRVIDSPGDNLLASFSSVTQAVDCAVEIQREMAERNEELPDDRKMEYRIGVNLGDVIEEGERIYGDGVNIAARLEALAEPGGICISGFVYNQVKNRLKLEYEYLGEQSVKNIKEPVPVYRVLSFPGAAAHRVIEAKKAAERESMAPSFRDKPSIAVLPFVNLSSDPEQKYFVDGLSEELLNSLSKIPDFHVTSRTSSFSFQGTNKTIQEIASVLRVDNILEGSVRKAGNALRVTAQLIRAADDRHLWSETYNRELKDIFEVQEEIATAVADELKVTLGIDHSFRPLGGTENEKPYELYLYAQGQWHEGSFTRALEYHDRAIAIDPKFALAWASKAYLHNLLAISAPGYQTASERDAALNAAQRAIDLEPNLEAGYYSLAFTKMSKGDWIQAGLSFYKAIDLQTEPLFSEGISQAATHYVAVANFQKSNELHDKLRQNDPLNQIARANYMANLGVLGDIRRVEEEYKRCKELFGGPWIFGDSYIRILRLGTTAIVSLDEKDSQVPSWDPIGDKVSQYIGTPEKGLEELYQLYTENNSLSSKEFIYISVWAANFGDPEFALEAMEKGVSLEASGLFWVWIPVMKDVRQLPQFKEFVKEIGLVDYWNKFGWPDTCHQLDNGDFKFD